MGGEGNHRGFKAVPWSNARRIVGNINHACGKRPLRKWGKGGGERSISSVAIEVGSAGLRF